MRTRPIRIAVLLLAAASLAACGSGGLRLPTDPAGTELYEQGQQFLADEDWSKAVEAFDTLLRNYPTSPYLPQARLGLGRGYYEQARSDSYLLAIEAFRNFLTYHPSADEVDYAQLMIALGYKGLMRSPDRDQSNTRRALDAFEVFLEDYPRSSHREFALQQKQEVVDSLAVHELQVAEWQLENGHPEAAEARARYALAKYPETEHRCELLYALAESLRTRQDHEGANGYYEQILQEHPDCERAADARRRINRSQEAAR